MSDIHEIIRNQIKQPLWDNWYIKEELGRGATGVVYRIEAKRENRTDVSALKIEPIIADPTADADEAKHLYGVEFVDMSSIKDVDAVILAVAHNEFKELK